MTKTAEAVSAVPQGDSVSELAWLSAVDAVRLVRAREISAEELCAAVLAQLAAVNPAINAVVAVRSEAALAEARAADASKGEGNGPLHGIPFTVKDTSGTKDLPTTYGSVPLRGYRPAADDASVAALRRAGAILIGKTNTPEFAMRPPSTTNDLFGQTKNPWDRERSPGGSSGGAAAAVAAGIAPLAEGSDTGGSIRGPASCCGVVGLKPSRGRVSSAPFFDGAAGLMSKGPLARTVRDVALMLDALCDAAPTGPEGKVPRPPGGFLERCNAQPTPTRIGCLSQGLTGNCDDEVLGVYDRIIELLEGSGHVVERIELPVAEFSQRHQLIFHVWNATQVLRMVDPSARSALTEWTRTVIADAGETPATAYCAAVDEMRELASRTYRTISTYDFVVTPTIVCLPPPIDGWPSSWQGESFKREVSQMVGFTSIFNDLGLPALSLPAGMSAAALPIGIQIAGQHGADAEVIALAAELESGLGLGLYTDHRPSFPT